MTNLQTQLEQDFKAGLLSKELFLKYTEGATQDKFEAPCLRSELFVREVDLSAYRLFGKLSEQEVEALYHANFEEFRHYILEGYDYLTAINWNKYNEVKNQGVTLHFGLMDPFVPLPRHNGAKVSSFLEAYLIFHTNLGRANYEDSQAVVEYTTVARYKPDFTSITNPNIIFEAKGIFRDAAEAKKYKLVSEQSGKIIIFVFQSRNVQIMWQKPRVDGTRQTHEQWCQKNGFLYTYADEFDDFIKSATYRNLLSAYNKQ